MSNQIASIVLIVNNLDQSLKFYNEKLGLDIVRKDNGYAELGTLDVTLELIESDNVKHLIDAHLIKIPDKDRVPSSYYAWESTDNLDLTYKNLKSKGVEFHLGPVELLWGEKVAYFKDPDGNLWEVVEKSEK